MKVFAFCLLLLCFGVANAQQMPNAASASKDNDSVRAMEAPPAAGHSTMGVHVGEQSFKKVADRKFWAVTGAMTASTVVAADLTGKCENQGTCTFMDPFNSRKKMFALALPVNFGMMELTYRMKRSGNRLWFVPAVAGTAFNTFVAVHSAHYVR